MTDPYFAAIEEHYRALKGRASVMLSPADWQQVSRWKVSGIPVVVVIRGIDVAFSSFAGRNKREEINSVKYCEREIMEEWRKTRC